MSVDGLGRRADEDQTRVATRGREAGVLGEEAVAGMHRLGVRRRGGARIFSIER